MAWFHRSRTANCLEAGDFFRSGTMHEVRSFQKPGYHGIPAKRPFSGVTEHRGPVQKDSMPYVQLRVAGNLTKEQKQEITAQFTRTLEEVAGKPPAATYIVIEEVSRENWAKGGKLLADS